MEELEAKNQVAAALDVEDLPREDQKSTAVIDFKMVTFSLAEKDYSIDIMHVKEIAKAGRFTFVPNTLPFVLGVYNLRGEIIPILDLRLFFNIEVPPREPDRLENMLILQVEDQKFGVVVDRIDKVIGVQKSSIQPPHPLFGDINIKYIDGVIESNKRLYVLLDITRIFTAKEDAEERQKAYVQAQNARIAQQNKEKSEANAPVQQKAEAPKIAPQLAMAQEKSPADIARGLTGGSSAPAQPATAPAADTKKIDEGVNLIKDSLLNFKKFNVSPVNESWVRHQYSVWSKTHGDRAQITSESEAAEFLKDFWSRCNDAWWTDDYAEAVTKLLPENSAKQIMVWNPGCGKGMETYSLACILQKKYPNAKVRIYAQDVDLLAVSNATLLSVPNDLANTWYGPYLTKKANGDYTFSKEIKESIMFEYHDCKNTNALPMVDVVYARDILSMLDQASQEAVINDFLEKMKGNAVAILGDNEEMPSTFTFGENTVGALVAYSKD